MAKAKEFSHITVTADDDDDVVIQAGVVEEPAAEEPVEEAPLEEPVDEPAAEEADDAVAEAVEEAAVEKEGAGETADAASYHETTLDDLEATKMSTTQKVIIVVAVLGIVAFAAWYLLAH